MNISKWFIKITLTGMLMVGFNTFAQSSNDSEFIGDPAVAFYYKRVNELGGLSASQKYAVKNSKKLSLRCNTCHSLGADSEKRKGKVLIPVITGQQPLYLFKQLMRLRAEKRLHPIMQSIVQRLSDENMLLLALRFSSLPMLERVKSNSAIDMQDKGKRIYRDICTHCHGVDAMGLAAIPRLKGQDPEYLAVTLKRFRKASIFRSHASMAAISAHLTDTDIASLAAYLEKM